jgi:hypothetical protein
MIYCDYLGSKLAMPRRSVPVEILTEHEPVSRLAWRRGTAVTWKNAQSSKPVDPAATNAEIAAVATQLGLDRRLAGGAEGAEIPTQGRPRNGGGQCRER